MKGTNTQIEREALNQTAESGNKRELVYIPIEKLHQHPDNPRKDLGDLTELAESIKTNGVMQNLTVVPCINSTDDYNAMLDGQGKYSEAYMTHAIQHAFEDDYTVVIGHRRLEAARLAGLVEVPCVVAQMDYPTQVATMMTENLQRVDLTIYEQAQGFKQLSFDLGMSVQSIADKTGFSASTVRRRLKLCELNQQTLRDVSARQITIADLEKLNEIKDPAKRDQVLMTIGTNNFEYQFLAAKNEQERKEKEESWRELMTKRGYIELGTQTRHGTMYKTEFLLSCNADEAILDERIEPDVQYYWFVDHGTLYVKSLKTEVEKSAAATKAETEREKRMEAAERLEDAFIRAYTLRFNFIKDYSETEAKSRLSEILRMGYECNRDMNCIFNHGELHGFSEDELDEHPYTPGWDKLIERNKTGQFKTFLYYIYSSIGDNPTLRCYNTYTRDTRYAEYNQTTNSYPKLVTIYESLERLGYEMSDEERELLDGTSALYYRSENPEESEE